MSLTSTMNTIKLCTHSIVWYLFGDKQKWNSTRPGAICIIWMCFAAWLAVHVAKTVMHTNHRSKDATVVINLNIFVQFDILWEWVVTSPLDLVVIVNFYCGLFYFITYKKKMLSFGGKTYVMYLVSRCLQGSPCIYKSSDMLFYFCPQVLPYFGSLRHV